MSSLKPENERQDDTPEETLAQRSARLEAEAAAGIFAETPTDPGNGNKALQEKIKALETELDKTKEQMLRALAEAENARKRTHKERDDASKYAISNFSKDLINVADNLRRALAAIPADAMTADPHLKNLNDGVEATERELLKSFEKHGIRKISPEGEIFNPNYHEVMFEAAGTGKPPGTVVQVMETGYILNDRLLRPARVSVAKNEGQGSDDTPGSRIDTKA